MANGGYKHRGPKRYIGAGAEDTPRGLELFEDPTGEFSHYAHEGGKMTRAVDIERAMNIEAQMPDILRKRHDLPSREAPPGDYGGEVEREGAYWTRIFGGLPTDHKQEICSQAKCKNPISGMHFNIRPLCEICSNSGF